MKPRIHRRVWLPLLLACLAVTAFAALAADFPLSLTDDEGTVIRLAKKPLRLISLAPSNTEILFAVGAGEAVVGVTNFCDYPAAAQKKEKIGDSFTMNYEKILALKPDLVLAVKTMQSDESLKRLRDLGLTVMVVNPTDLASTLGAIKKMGRATGHAREADLLAAQMQKRRDAVGARLGRLDDAQRPRVFWEVWNNPIMTAGPGTFVAELIRLGGGRDIAADAASPWSVFSEELILARNPEVIVSQCASAAEIVKRPAWSGLAAVKAGRVYDVDQNLFSRPGPRLIDALEILAKLLHPEKFAGAAS